jgi:branched-chain amino acid transport system substrate-binding protein
VFRVVGRDDQQGIIAGDYLAEHWGEKEIVILRDGQPYGAGIAAEIRKQLSERGLSEVLNEQITPGQVDYSDVVSRLPAAGADVLYYGGYVPEAGLLIRQARARDYGVQLVSADGLSSEDFWRIAGTAAEGTLFTSFRDTSGEPGAGQSSSEPVRASSSRTTGCYTATVRCRPGRQRWKGPDRLILRRSARRCAPTSSTPCWVASASAS